MRYPARRAVISAAVIATLLGFGAVASAQGPNKCLAGKNKCASKKMQGLLKCHSKAEKNGVAVDPACTSKATAKFDGGTAPAKGCFAKLETKNDGPCLTTGDSAAMENKVDAFVTDVVNELDPGFPTPVQNDCSAAKKKCVLKKAAALLKCHEKAVKDGTPPLADPACVNKAIGKFGGFCDGGANADAICHVDSECPGSTCEKGCFTKLEDKGGCITTGDSVALEDKADAFVQDVLCELGYTTLNCGPPPTPTPSATKTPTPTPTATCSPGFAYTGALPPTTGHFNYNLTLGLPGANSACNGHFSGSHACTYIELKCAQGAGSLVGAMDTPHCQVGPNANAFCTNNSECPSSTCASNPISSYWAIDPAAAPLAQCVDDAAGGSNQRWEYATAHTASRGQNVGLNNGTGALGPLQTNLQCNLSGSSSVGCCQ